MPLLQPSMRAGCYSQDRFRIILERVSIFVREQYKLIENNKTGGAGDFRHRLLLLYGCKHGKDALPAGILHLLRGTAGRGR